MCILIGLSNVIGGKGLLGDRVISKEIKFETPIPVLHLKLVLCFFLTIINLVYNSFISHVTNQMNPQQFVLERLLRSSSQFSVTFVIIHSDN